MGAAAYGGKGFKGSARVSGERPIGTGGRTQQHNQASCHPPAPLWGRGLGGPFNTFHFLREAVRGQVQVWAPYTVLFGGDKRIIRQCVISDDQPLVNSSFWQTRSAVVWHALADFFPENSTFSATLLVLGWVIIW